MTHKSIDALLASTMFLLFVLVTPNFNMIADKIGIIQSADALAYSASYYYPTGYSVTGTTVTSPTTTVKTATSSTTTATAVSPTTSTATTSAVPTTTSTAVKPATSVTTSTTSSTTTATAAPVTATSTAVKPATSTTTTSGCTSTTAPWVKVLSPNGGEVYISEQQVAIKWDSCNISSTQAIGIFLTDSSGNNSLTLTSGGTNNDGSESLSLDPQGLGIPYGKYYKIRITAGSGTMFPVDLSDSEFTINRDTNGPNVTLNSTTPASQTIIAGSRYIPIAYFNINNPTSSDINIGSFVLWEKGNVGNIQGLELYDSNNTQISEHLTGKDGIDGFYFSKMSFVVKANSSAKIIVKADISTSAISGSKTGVAFGKGGGFKLSDNSAVELGADPDINANLMTVTTSGANTSCTNWKVTSGGPQGGTYWENLKDFSKHPEIDQYRIQWFNGNWSNWYISGVGDTDSKKNNNGSSRYVIAYKQDHNWQTRDCIDGQTQNNSSITLVSPNGGENFPVGGKMAVNWKTTNVPATHNVHIQISNLDIPLGVNDGSEIVVIPKTNADGEPTIGGLSSARILTLSPDKTYDVIDFSDTEVGIKTDLGMVGCASKTAPCINVLSPNGGETYSPGQSVTVKWRTQGLTPSALVGISLRTMNNNLPYAIQGYDYHINDGEETITLPDPVILPNGYTANDKFAISLQAYEPTGSGAVIATDQSDGVFTIADSTSKPTSCGKSVSNTKDLPYNSAGVSFQFFPDSSVSTAEIGTKDVDIGDGFFVNGKGCLTELSLDFYSGWEGTVLEGAVYLINKDGDVLATTKLNNYSQATFKDINFELNGQDTLFVSVDLANEFSQKGLIHTLNQHVTIMGYKYIRSDHDTIYNVKDGVNRLGTVIVYDDVEPQTLPISHLYIKNTTSAKSVAASSKRNTKIATFDMQGYLGARPGNIAFQIGSDSSTPNLKNSIYFINTKTGDRAKMSNVGAYYTFDFSEVRHEWDTMQTYALYVNKPKDTSARAKTYPVSYLGVQEANNMDNYQSDTMFLKLTLKK